MSGVEILWEVLFAKQTDLIWSPFPAGHVRTHVSVMSTCLWLTYSSSSWYPSMISVTVSWGEESPGWPSDILGSGGQPKRGLRASCQGSLTLTSHGRMPRNNRRCAKGQQPRAVISDMLGWAGVGMWWQGQKLIHKTEQNRGHVRSRHTISLSFYFQGHQTLGCFRGYGPRTGAFLHMALEILKSV